MRVVVIGNGVAGMEAAIAIRNRDAACSVTIVSEESDHLFSRPALMWVHCGQMSHRDIEPHERDVYARMGFERVRARAIGIDVERHQVRFAGELPPLPYDRLLIACGSRARPAPWPGSDARGVGHFVTLQDLHWYETELFGQPSPGQPPRHDVHQAITTIDSPYRLRDAAATGRGAAARQPAIIGGGLIGIEAVEVALARGFSPHFFIREEWFWPMALDAREAAWICERMTEHGVQVHLGHELVALHTDDANRVSAVETNKGRFDCDVVTVAIGVVPNTAWLQGSSIALDAQGAITVSDNLATRAPDVFAAGDCAAVGWFDGSRRPEPLWYSARDQGRVAARSLMGDAAEYHRGTWYNSAKLVDIEYTTVGLVNMRVEAERNWFHEERGDVRSTTRIVTSGERVVGFNCLGRRWDHSVLVEWIEQRRELAWVLKHLRDAAFDTEFVPPLVVPSAFSSPTSPST